MEKEFLLKVDELVSTLEWKHKETYDDILEYIKTKVDDNKKEQLSLKQSINTK